MPEVRHFGKGSRQTATSVTADEPNEPPGIKRRLEPRPKQRKPTRSEFAPLDAARRTEKNAESKARPPKSINGVGIASIIVSTLGLLISLVP